METLLSNRTPEPLLPTSAVSKWLGIATRTLCLWAECREIPAIKVGRQWRFRESELASWLRNHDDSKVRKLTFAPAAATHGRTACADLPQLRQGKHTVAGPLWQDWLQTPSKRASIPKVGNPKQESKLCLLTIPFRVIKRWGHS